MDSRAAAQTDRGQDEDRRGHHTQGSLEATPDIKIDAPHSKAAASSTQDPWMALCTGSLCKGTRDQRLAPRQGWSSLALKLSNPQDSNSHPHHLRVV